MILQRSFMPGIQVLRGVAALAVVFVHLNLYEHKWRGEEQILPSWMLHGAAGVDLFFVISGFIMVHVTAAAGNGIRAAGRFLLSRFVRIYPIYWVYCGIVLGVALLAPTIVNTASGGRMHIWQSLALWPDSSLIIPVSWTLKHEVYFYAVFALTLICQRIWLGKILVAWILVMTILPFLLPATAVRSAYGVTWMSGLTYEFIAGAFLALAASRVKFWWPAWSLGAAVAWMIVVCATMSERPESWRPVIYGVPATLALFGVVGIDQSGKFQWSRRFIWLGDISYSLYLGHMLVLSAVWRLGRNVHLVAGSEALGLSMIGVVGSVAMAAASYRWCEAPLATWLKRRRREIAADGPDSLVVPAP